MNKNSYLKFPLVLSGMVLCIFFFFIYKIYIGLEGSTFTLNVVIKRLLRELHNNENTKTLRKSLIHALRNKKNIHN